VSSADEWRSLNRK